MPTPSQRTFLLRHRLKIAGVYALLLLLSWLTEALRQSPPPPPLPTTPPLRENSLLVLLDRLETDSAEHVLHSAGHLVDHGFGVRSPILPGLNGPDPAEHTFQDLADTIRPLSYPEVVIANGHAGAVALQYAAAHPEKVRALILVDASGVQEFTMMGEYHLNYALYLISDGALMLLDNLIPHFGTWHSLQLRRGQLGLLRRSDRRELRPLFEQINQPTLLLEHDPDPTENSKLQEHARLLPQSRILHLNAEEAVEPALGRFLAQLDAGTALTRQELPSSVLLEADPHTHIPERPRPRGVDMMLLLLGIALATLVTEDLTCAVTGLMIANGNLTWLEGMSACLAGILLGDYLLFWAGRAWGRTALERVPLRWMIDPLALRETEDWFRERAAKAILISRCIPGTRLPAYVAAGMLGVPIRVFTLWFLVAAMIWTPLIIGLATIVADQALTWLDQYHHIAPALMILGAILYFSFTHLLLPSLNWRGRRKVIGKWRRLTRSEYWPATVYYTPVVFRLLLRFFRKEEGVMDFTACNPCIPGSGVVEESKSRILDQFEARDAVARYLLLPSSASVDEQEQAVREWMQTLGLTFPLVLKPDAGQRGEQVTIVDREDDLRPVLKGFIGSVVAQEFIPGQEFGVFYIRHPDAEEGFIYGITLKTLPVLKGDGIRNIEDLILADERTVCQAPQFLREQGENLYRIPAAGERVSLSRIGNHARGTRFGEGGHLITPELTNEVDRIARSIPGFHYGRFDLIAADEETLQTGQDLKVIELNGVTSESTNLYAPEKRFPERIRILLGQWEHASAIGQWHREHGTRVMSFRLLLRHFDRYRKRRHAILLQKAPTRRMDHSG